MASYRIHIPGELVEVYEDFQDLISGSYIFFCWLNTPRKLTGQKRGQKLGAVSQWKCEQGIANFLSLLRNSKGTGKNSRSRIIAKPIHQNIRMGVQTNINVCLS